MGIQLFFRLLVGILPLWVLMTFVSDMPNFVIAYDVLLQGLIVK